MTDLKHFPRIVACIGVLSLATHAVASTPQQDLIERVKSVTQEFGDQLGAVLARDADASYGILIVPGMVRAALGVGGHSGSGILVRHDPESGVWSSPLFYDVAGAGLGPQIGYERQNVILVITSAEALDEMIAGDANLALDARMTLGSRGVEEQLSATQDDVADVHVYSQGHGAFVGAEVSAMILAAKHDWNATLEIQPIKASEILGPLALIEAPDMTSRFP